MTATNATESPNSPKDRPPRQRRTGVEAGGSVPCHADISAASSAITTPPQRFRPSYAARTLVKAMRLRYCCAAARPARGTAPE